MKLLLGRGVVAFASVVAASVSLPQTNSPNMSMLASAASASTHSKPLVTGRSAAFQRPAWPIAASPHYLAYLVEDFRGGRARHHAVWVRHGVRRKHRIAMPRTTSESASIAGDYLAAYGHHRVHWWNMADRTHGTRRLARVSGRDRRRMFVSASPNGWLSLVFTSRGRWRMFATDARTGHVSRIPGPVNFDLHNKIQIATGPSGVVLSDEFRVEYVPFSAPRVRMVDTGGFGDVVCWSAMGDVAGCTARVSGKRNTRIVRVPLDGGTPTHVATLSNTCGAQVAATATATGWVPECAGGTKLSTRSVAGGQVATSTYGVTASIETDGSEILMGVTGITAGGVFYNGGIRATNDASKSPTLVSKPGGGLKAVTALSISPGRVAYVDDSTRRLPLYARSVSMAGRLQIESQTLLQRTAGGDGTWLSVYGKYAAFGLGGDPWSLRVVGPGLDKRLATRHLGGLPFQLSGTRLLYSTTSSHHPNAIVSHLFDLRTRQVQSVPGTHHANVALWGNYIAYFKDDGSLWRRDLTSNGPAHQVLGPSPSSHWAGYVTMWGDYVGWRQLVGSTHRVGFRNMRTSGPIVPLPEYLGLKMTSNGVLYTTGPEGGRTHLYLRSYSGRVIDTGVAERIRDFAADQSRLVWLAEGGRPARIAALPHVADPPRFLGNAIAPRRFSPTGGAPWTTYLPTSASLRRCRVEIRRGRHLTRSLDCGASRRLGIGIVRWDGRNSQGRPVPAGRYRWRFVAANADGSLRRASGAVGPVTGHVTVE